MAKNVVVIGNTPYQLLFAPSGIDPVGKTVRVGSERFEVVGVFDKRPSAGGFNLGQDDFVAIPYTPLALAAVAELYEEMGRGFSEAKYFHESIKAYQFLRTQYPQHRLSRDALCAIGEVYRADLDDPEAARQAFQQLLERTLHE
jgi:hypothetical protein